MSGQTIPFGERHYDLPSLPGTLVRRVEGDAPPVVQTPAEIVNSALANPIGSAPLRELAQGKRTAAILIPGKDRVAGARDFMPALLAELNQAGIPDDRIDVYLATGTHDYDLKADGLYLLGEETAARVRCRGHNPRAEETLRYLGTTSRGTPVSFQRDFLDADVKVLTGRIVPHYFAGFSGGRKALIPGVAGFKTIVANHRLTIDPISGIHPEIYPGSLAANPVHLDMVEAARMVHSDFCLNTIFHPAGGMIAALSGEMEAVHTEGSRLARKWLCATLPEPVDVLVTSSGGAPHDCNFMQALKTAFNVQDLVRPGGAMLWIAECPGGMNPGFLQLGAIASDGELEQNVRARYTLMGHNSLMLRSLTRRVDVALWSTLPPEQPRHLGLHPIGSHDEAIAWLRSRVGASSTYAVVPHANVIAGVRNFEATGSQTKSPLAA